jgi:ribonuclease E
VIKRGQIMLIQVSKEERGNKGAAVTTYLSLPGRYCVLMPNSPRGGGVSRKIASFKDRKRMKDMLDDLSVPEGMSVILRTAGVARTKVEIKRDLDYLTRLWNTIREHTLKSSAPALIYEEGNLIKRAIRDLYTRDIEDVYVQGDDGYHTAKEFMKMLMPSHAKKVQEYKNDRVPLFHKFGVESQINDIGEPTVNLRSGGYLVINPTEALVSIDVNSGRATKERHIEETALKTNLEAADELARQLRLRDLGGLVVVDFIDMEDRRNNRKVEQRLRDALSTDRARIQVGRISSFGLLELSRQRLNPSLAEAQTEICAHCAGTGRTRTLDFAAISIIRALEAEGIKGKSNDIVLTMCPHVALYILNHKRHLLNDIEQRYGFTITIETDSVMSNTQFTLEATAKAVAPKINAGISVVAVSSDSDESYDEENEAEEVSEDTDEANEQQPRQARPHRDAEEGESRSRRRRGRRGGRNRRGNDRGDRQGSPEEQQAAEGENASTVDSEAVESEAGEDTSREGGQKRRRNRDRRPRREEGDPSGNDQVPTSAAVSESVIAQPTATSETFSSRPPAVSNDMPPAAPPVRDYETVNQPPEKKKKGWWNKLVE